MKDIIVNNMVYEHNNTLLHGNGGTKCIIIKRSLYTR